MDQLEQQSNELAIILDELDSDVSFERLATELNAFASNGTIDLSSAGSGFIKRIKIENGFNLRIWDYTYPRSIVFRKPAGINGKAFFHICYPINTADFLVSNSIFPKLVHLPWGRNIVCFSSDATVNMNTLADKKFKAIDISFTLQWLKETFREDPQILKIIDELLNSTEPLILLDSASPGEQLAISQLHESVQLENLNGLQFKAKVLLLVDEFFTRLSRLGKEQLQGKKIVYDEQIHAVKNMLQEYVQESFPGLEIISKKVALSESTIKRYFKTVFNQTIYEHYLQLKMEHAKKLIADEHHTVNEAATILKYEKVSSFIETFKKHYGYSPGRLKKNTL